MSNPRFTISILTATYNSADVIAGLVASLEAQTDTDFEWVVVDGASIDATLEHVEAARIASRVIVSEPDFGVYDALNKGLLRARSDYYLVLGADDTLAPDAVANYRRALRDAVTPPDLVTADVLSGQGRCRALRHRPWLYGMQSYISAHSVGTLVRRELHDRIGLYSRRFPIGADQYFIKKAVQSGACVKYCDFCAGSFGSKGMSSVDTIGTLTEFLRVQMATESGKALQLLLFVLRLLKNYRRL